MGASDARETAGVTTRLIVSYVRRLLGDAGVDRLLELAGDDRPVAALEDELGWSSYRQKVALFDAAERLTGDTDVARHIGEALFDERLAAPLKLLIGALGSPQQVLRSCARVNAKFSTNSTMEVVEASRGHAVVTYRVDAGYVPDRHDCLYTQGILTQVSVLFGSPPAVVTHDECQVLGAPMCRYAVTWQRRSLWGRRRREPVAGGALTEVEMLQERVADLEDTVADLVSPHDLDDVLGRIATRAGAAVRGQRFLLVVELEGERGPRVVSDGFDAPRATQLGTDLLAGVDRDDEAHDRLVVPVASARRTYGYLAAYLPVDKGFLPHEQGQLEAYGRLAAAAIDSATSLADARRGEATAEAVLALAHDLAQLQDECAAAERVADAVRSVVGADRGFVVLGSGAPHDPIRVSAHRDGDPMAARIQTALRAGETGADQELVAALLGEPPRSCSTTDAEPRVRRLLALVGADLAVVAPITLRGATVGAVIATWADGHEALPDDAAVRSVAGLADHAGTAIGGLRSLAQARHQATHDPLTGLANRALLDEGLERALVDRHRRGGLLGVCFIDLDGFKGVNDVYGHAAGDLVLVEVARRIHTRVRASDLVARVSGDEFVVVLRDLVRPGDAADVATWLVEALRQPFSLEHAEVSIGASVGLAVAPADGALPDVLLRAADAAMYEAKVGGGGARRASGAPGVPTSLPAS